MSFNSHRPLAGLIFLKLYRTDNFFFLRGMLVVSQIYYASFKYVIRIDPTTINFQIVYDTFISSRFAV